MRSGWPPMGFTARLAAGLAVLLLAVACSQTDADADAKAYEVALMNSAQGYLAKGNNAAAAIQLKALLQRRPKSAEGRYLLGKVLLEIGDSASAEAELRRALEYEYPKKLVLAPLATALLAQQKYAALIREFGEIEPVEPLVAAELKTYLAVAHGAMGTLVLAEAANVAALGREPTFVPALMMKARLLADRGNLGAARALTEDIVRKDPGLAEAWVLMGDLLQLGRAPAAEAIAAYRKALVLRADLLPAHVGLMAMLIRQAELDTAAEQLAHMKKALPGRPPTVFYEALLAYLQGDPKRALLLAQVLLRSAPDNPRILLLAAQAESATGAVAQAEVHLRQAIQAAPEATEPRLLLAQALVRSGRAAGALDLLKDLLASPKPSAEALAVAGQAQLLLGETKKAEASFALAAKIKPGDTDVRLARALSMMAAGQDDKALGEIQSLAATDSANTAADLALISARLRRREFDAAFSAVDRLAQKIPVQALPEYLRGRVAFLRGDSAAARRAFELALTKNDRYLPSIISLAELDLADKLPDSAKSRIEVLLKVDPQNAQAWLALVDLWRRSGGGAAEITGVLQRAAAASPSDAGVLSMVIDHQYSLGNLAAALAAARAAHAALPEAPELLDRLGRMQLLNGQANLAITTFNNLAVLQPNSALAQLRLAEAYRADNNGEAAGARIRRALLLAPAWLPAQRANVELALRENNPAQAVALARAIQTQQPAEAIGFALEGDVQASQQNWDAAASSFRKALTKNNPADVPARLHMALVKGNKATEAAQFEQAWLKDHPRDTAFRHRQGEAAMLRNEWDLAADHFRQVLAINADDSGALNNLAYLGAKFNKPGALPMAERAVTLAPQRAEYWDTLAFVHSTDMQIGKAIDAQRKAVELAPQSGGLRLSLAKFYLQAGAKEKASSELASLAKLGDRFSDHAEVARLREEAGARAPPRDADAPTLPVIGATRLAERAWPPSLPLYQVLLAAALLALALPLVLIIAAVRAPSFQVERSIIIHAPAVQIFSLLQDFHEWERWSTWKQFSRPMTRSLTGAAAGLGAVYNWKNSRKIDEGHIEIRELAPPHSLTIEVSFERPDEFTHLSEITLQAAADGACLVHWVCQGPQPFAMRVVGVLRSVDRRIGKALGANLAALKAVAEGVPANAVDSSNKAALVTT